MRDILSISMPEETIQLIKRKVKKRGFSSISAYIRLLVESDADEDLISEKELLEIIKESEADFKAGRCVAAKSLLDLYESE